MAARATLLCALFLGSALLAWAGRSLSAELSTLRDLHQGRYVSAAQCARCHPDHSASFRRTFHRTMTQAASPHSVRGDFSGAELRYFGVTARMERGARGEFLVRYQGPGVPPQAFTVEMTIGSRRYQQYVARRGQELVRLPVAYHLEEQRWFHMNGAFLTPDPPHDAALVQADYERHVTRWNDNCIFCHNVAPNPGLTQHSGLPRFESQVAELGIGCEACHGPGGEHEQRNANPLRRYLLHLSDRHDPAIVQPARLSQERSLDVCGRCHGQRITDDVGRFLTHGDPFVPGDDLALYSAPLWRDSTLRDEPAFEARFWADGTPRLTAYEYQGVLQSACAQRGELTCLSCHSMHQGDPRGQLRPDRPDHQLCTQCHMQLAPQAAQRAHAHHPEPQALPGCVDCHMPKLVFGVLDLHRSHRIELPSPARADDTQRPDACTLCHVSQSRDWAREQVARLWSKPLSTAPQPAGPEVERRLFAGDPIERAVAAHALGAAPSALRGPLASALLLEVLEQDPYPAVRQLALRALHAHGLGHELPANLAEQPLPRRVQLLAEIRAHHLLPEAQRHSLSALRAQAQAQAIEIGE